MGIEDIVDKAINLGGQKMLLDIKKQLKDKEIEGMIINKEIIDEILSNLSDDDVFKNYLKS